MWPGPYGEWGSRKYLVASCDQSLKRMGLEYVDIFYSHRPDPDTPLEETMGALDYIVRSGRALYAGISSYSAEQTAQAAKILKELGTPCLIHQPSYNMFNRWIEDGLTASSRRRRSAASCSRRWRRACSPTSTSTDIPEDSRAAKHTSLNPDAITPDKVGEGAQAQRHREGARPVAGADGGRLDAARPGRHVVADRREQGRARGRGRRARSTTSSSRRASSPRSRPR